MKHRGIFFFILFSPFFRTKNEGSVCVEKLYRKRASKKSTLRSENLRCSENTAWSLKDDLSCRIFLPTQRWHFPEKPKITSSELRVSLRIRVRGHLWTGIFKSTAFLLFVFLSRLNILQVSAKKNRIGSFIYQSTNFEPLPRSNKIAFGHLRICTDVHGYDQTAEVWP